MAQTYGQFIQLKTAAENLSRCNLIFRSWSFERVNPSGLGAFLSQQFWWMAKSKRFDAKHVLIPRMWEDVPGCSEILGLFAADAKPDINKKMGSLKF